MYNFFNHSKVLVLLRLRNNPEITKYFIFKKNYPSHYFFLFFTATIAGPSVSCFTLLDNSLHLYIRKNLFLILLMDQEGPTNRYFSTSLYFFLQLSVQKKSGSNTLESLGPNFFENHLQFGEREYLVHIGANVRHFIFRTDTVSRK